MYPLKCYKQKGKFFKKAWCNRFSGWYIPVVTHDQNNLKLMKHGYFIFKCLERWKISKVLTAVVLGCGIYRNIIFSCFLFYNMPEFILSIEKKKSGISTLKLITTEV